MNNASFSGNFKNVNNLEQLNSLLSFENKTEMKDAISINWNGRKFNLTDSQGNTTTVKMKEIINKFNELAKNEKNKSNPDEKLINSIHDNIVALGFEGKKELAKQNSWMQLYKDTKNLLNIFSSNTLKLDKIMDKNIGEKEIIINPSKDHIENMFSLNEKTSSFHEGVYNHLLTQELTEKFNAYKNPKYVADNKIQSNKYKEIMKEEFFEAVKEKNAEHLAGNMLKEDKQTENIIRSLVKNQPENALVMIQSMQKAIKSEQFKDNPKLSDVKKFLESMKLECIARQPLGTEQRIQQEELNSILSKINNSEQFCKEFEELNLNHEQFLKEGAEKNPKIFYPIINTIANRHANLEDDVKANLTEKDTKLSSFCKELEKKMYSENKAFGFSYSRIEQYSKVPFLPISTQRELHNEAKKELFRDLTQQGASIEFTKPASRAPSSAIQIKDYNIDNKNRLNSNVFSCQVTKGVQGDILEGSKRADGRVKMVFVCSQSNLSEQPDRDLIKPEEAVVKYKTDPTQGPQAQLAFSDQQVKTICSVGSKLNTLSPILNENTKTSTVNGYFSPTNENVDEIIDQLETRGHLVEYPCIGSIPTGGDKPVHQFFAFAPAVGLVGMDTKLNAAKSERVQYLKALDNFRGAFEQAIKLADKEGPVSLDMTAIGLGAFQNNPNVVAKAYYEAALEYQDRLAEKDVKVDFKVYEGAHWNYERKAKDGAHKMATLLFNEIKPASQAEVQSS